MIHHDRYIELNGKPVHQPLWQHFLKAADTQTSAFATAALTAYTATYHANEYKTLTVLVAGTLGAIFAKTAWSYCEKLAIKDIFKKNAAMKCIDTAPERRTAPTSEDDMSAARQMKIFNTVSAVMAASTLAICTLTGKNWLDRVALPADISNLTELGVSTAVITIFTAGPAKFTAGHFRFKKVVNKDWVITDTAETNETPAKKPGGKIRSFAPQMV